MGLPQYRPPNTIFLIMGTPLKGTPNVGKPPVCSDLTKRDDIGLEVGKTRVCKRVIAGSEITTARSRSNPRLYALSLSLWRYGALARRA